MKPAPVAGFVRLWKNLTKINYNNVVVYYKSVVCLLKRNRYTDMNKFSSEDAALEFAQTESKRRNEHASVVFSVDEYFVEFTSLPAVRSSERLVAMYKNGIKVYGNTETK